MSITHVLTFKDIVRAEKAGCVEEVVRELGNASISVITRADKIGRSVPVLKSEEEDYRGG
jgi:hypothetical protein